MPGCSQTALSRGYGNYRITSTTVEHVWWVQYFNFQGDDYWQIPPGIPFV
jgi:hypothetical protein